jgi:hypothetical protein
MPFLRCLLDSNAVRPAIVQRTSPVIPGEVGNLEVWLWAGLMRETYNALSERYADSRV